LVPWLFLALALPPALITNGFNNVLSYFLRVDGLPMDQIANKVALLGIPPMLYFLWSPLTDLWFRRRAWVLGSALIAGAALYTAFRMPTFGTSGATALLLIAVSVGELVSASGGGLLAATVSQEQKTRVASTYEMGNLGGGALGGGCILLFSRCFSRTVVGVVAAGLLIVPALAVLGIAETQRARPVENIADALRETSGEFRRTFWSWSGLPTLLLICSPIGSGAAGNLLAGLALDFHVSTGQIIWVTGILGGLLTAAGALVIALSPSHYDKRVAYATAGLVNALMIALLCFGRPRPEMFMVGAALYLLTLGICNALFTVLIFELLGAAGRSASSRYALLFSLGNTSVAYMSWVDGRGYSWFGPRGLPGTEALVTVITAITFLWWLRSRGFYMLPHARRVHRV
jgi:hypothetical protein